MATPNWANRTIFTGDNLDIMRGMNAETVDLIYLDPPFNSNKNYSAPVGSKAAGAAFKDTWTLSDLDVAWMGLIADLEPAIYKLLETAQLTHGKGMQSYLCMMAVRLLEMRRVLKETGSIYLHCDDTASHYLKLLMDATFGRKKFRNEIIWNRTRGKGLNPTKYVRNCDRLLYYSNGGRPVWNQQYEPFDESYGSDWRKDDRGHWEPENLTGGRAGGPEAYLAFKGVTPATGRAWAPPTRDKFPENIQLPGNYEELDSLAKCYALDAAGLIHWPEKDGGMPRYKKYLSSLNGKYASDLIADTPPVGAHAKERIGYPTQKPLALLKRIIKASSNGGDVVLDPFAGCATACVASEQLGRQWIGIDLSPKAVELVNYRLKETLGSLYHFGFVTSRKDIPQRTDIDAPIHYRQNKHVLYGQQEGTCNGCKTDFPFRIFDVDHVVPKSKGGTDHLDNLQLLCSSCNRIKGNRPMAYLMAQLAEMSKGMSFA